jgi:hypothetical protein
MKPEANKLKIEKLTIEISGKPITPHLKILADGKQIGSLKSLKITADEDDILVNIEMIQKKTVEVDGKKETVEEPIILKWGK